MIQSNSLLISASSLLESVTLGARL
jgi:hypothetical protein